MWLNEWADCKLNPECSKDILSTGADFQPLLQENELSLVPILLSAFHHALFCDLLITIAVGNFDLADFLESKELFNTNMKKTLKKNQLILYCEQDFPIAKLTLVCCVEPKFKFCNRPFEEGSYLQVCFCPSTFSARCLNGRARPC
jgi:hypothetical protein